MEFTTDQCAVVAATAPVIMLAALIEVRYATAPVAGRRPYLWASGPVAVINGVLVVTLAFIGMGTKLPPVWTSLLTVAAAAQLAHLIVAVSIAHYRHGEEQFEHHYGGPK